MELNLSRPICFFDLETTGIDVTKDRIVEISVFKVYPNQSKESLYFLVNPTIPIPIQASLVHGIYDKDVENAPKFHEISQKIFDFMADSDLAGFNSNRFDIPMLREEMLRCQLDLNIEERNCIDVQVIFHKMEQRTLEAAYKFYCGKTLENAHSAKADTLATYEVLKAQLDKYPELKNDMNFLAKEFNYNSDHLDAAKRFKKTDNGVIVCFGKYKDKLVKDVAAQDPGYFKWMYGADFALDTKQAIKKLSEELGFSI